MYSTHNLRCMIDRHGKEVTLRVNSTSGSYDPSGGTVTGAATNDYTVMAYPSEYNLMERQATEIVDGMRKVLLSTLDDCGAVIPEPEPNDTILGIGDTVTIHRVQTIYSGGPVCYICHVKE